MFVGFALSEESALGIDPAGPGWYFVFEEYPGEPRFGFDEVADRRRPMTPDELAWAHVPLTASGHADVSQPLAAAADVQADWGRNAAATASLTFQQPFRVAMHASRLLAEEQLMADLAAIAAARARGQAVEADALVLADRLVAAKADRAACGPSWRGFPGASGAAAGARRGAGARGGGDAVPRRRRRAGERRDAAVDRRRRRRGGRRGRRPGAPGPGRHPA